MSLRVVRSSSSLTPAEQDAVDALVGMGDRRPDAEALLDRVKSGAGAPTAADALIREMLRVRGAR